MEENNQVNESEVVEQPEVSNAWEKFKSENQETFSNVEQVAQENNIEATISAAEPEVTAITTSDLASSSSEPQVLGSIVNGVIGTTTAPTPKSEDKPAKKEYSKVCIYSQKNISVPGIGKLLRGYQMVEKSIADKWIEKPYARIATPEEVAREFRK